jgi:hypothetical protein
MNMTGALRFRTIYIVVNSIDPGVAGPLNRGANLIMLRVRKKVSENGIIGAIVFRRMPIDEVELSFNGLTPRHERQEER